MPRLIILLLLITAPLVWASGVYKWTDADGNVHYGDQPPSTGAQQMKLPEVSSYQPRVIAQTGSAPAGVSVPGTPVQPTEGVPYTGLHILSPKNKAVVRDNQGKVLVALRAEPALQKGHQIGILIDGRPWGEKQVSTLIQINNVLRGTHTLQALIMEDAGKQLILSNSIEFTMVREQEEFDELSAEELAKQSKEDLIGTYNDEISSLKDKLDNLDLTSSEKEKILSGLDVNSLDKLSRAELTELIVKIDQESNIADAQLKSDLEAKTEASEKYDTEGMFDEIPTAPPGEVDPDFPSIPKETGTAPAYTPTYTPPPPTSYSP